MRSGPPNVGLKHALCGIVLRTSVRVVTSHDTKNFSQAEDFMLEWLTTFRRRCPTSNPTSSSTMFAYPT